jgi:hypothetical protein
MCTSGAGKGTLWVVANSYMLEALRNQSATLVEPVSKSNSVVPITTKEVEEEIACAPCTGGSLYIYDNLIIDTDFLYGDDASSLNEYVADLGVTGYSMLEIYNLMDIDKQLKIFADNPEMAFVMMLDAIHYMVEAEYAQGKLQDMEAI